MRLLLLIVSCVCAAHPDAVLDRPALERAAERARGGLSHTRPFWSGDEAQLQQQLTWLAEANQYSVVASQAAGGLQALGWFSEERSAWAEAERSMWRDTRVQFIELWGNFKPAECPNGSRSCRGGLALPECSGPFVSPEECIKIVLATCETTAELRECFNHTNGHNSAGHLPPDCTPGEDCLLRPPSCCTARIGAEWVDKHPFPPMDIKRWITTVLSTQSVRPVDVDANGFIKLRSECPIEGCSMPEEEEEFEEEEDPVDAMKREWLTQFKATTKAWSDRVQPVPKFDRAYPPNERHLVYTSEVRELVRRPTHAKSTIYSHRDVLRGTHHQKLLIHRASSRGQADSVAALLATPGVDVDVRDASTDGTSLHFASKNGHADVVSALLQAGADPNAQDRFGWTALMLAFTAAEPSEEHLVENGAHSNQAVIVRHLLEAGAEPSLGRTHAPDNNVALGTTAFHYGAMSNDAEHLKALRLLLDECSSCVDIEDEEGLTPLSLSAMHDSPRAFKMLLAYNASTTRLDERTRLIVQHRSQRVAMALSAHETTRLYLQRWYAVAPEKSAAFEAFEPLPVVWDGPQTRELTFQGMRRFLEYGPQMVAILEMTECACEAYGAVRQRPTKPRVDVYPGGLALTRTLSASGFTRDYSKVRWHVLCNETQPGGLRRAKMYVYDGMRLNSTALLARRYNSRIEDFFTAIRYASYTAISSGDPNGTCFESMFNGGDHVAAIDMFLPMLMAAVRYLNDPISALADGALHTNYPVDARFVGEQWDEPRWWATTEFPDESIDDEIVDERRRNMTALVQKMQKRLQKRYKKVKPKQEMPAPVMADRDEL